MMTRLDTIARAVSLGGATLLVIVAVGLIPLLAARAAIATAMASAQVCTTLDAETLRALKQDRKRVVVVVRSFQPPTPPSAALVVWLRTADKNARRAVTHFGMHPLRAYSADQHGKHQRFLVSLANHAAFIDENQPLCLEVGFDTSRGDVEGGIAEIGIALADTANPSGWAPLRPNKSAE